MPPRSFDRIGVATLSIVCACAAPGKGEGAASPEASAATGAKTSDGQQASLAKIVTENMDTSADPCTDFFQYACGGWLSRVEIPADKSRWGRFNELREENRRVLREILESSEAPAKSKAFYEACMNESAIDAAGVEPIAKDLEAARSVRDLDGLFAFVGRMHAKGIGPLFAIGADADYRDPTLEIAHIYQGGLGLPDREYYLEKGESAEALRRDYVAHIGRMFVLAGESEEKASKMAESILAFETRLAKSSTPRRDLRDPNKRYHRIEREGLAKLDRKLPWDAYFEAMGHPDIVTINVATPTFFEDLRGHVRKAGWKTVQAYLAWHVLRSRAPHLSKPFVDENFAFYGKRLAGQAQIEDRWKRCVDTTDGMLPEDLGKAYVARAFPGDSKQRAIEMLDYIERAFATRLPELSWMDEATRKAALEKMKKISREKIGYPDEWIDYGPVEIGANHVANVDAAEAFDFHRRMSRVGKPVDRKQWEMSPPTVNAYYNPTLNEMVFPAGILQPPFFHRTFAMAMNFGGIGMVMGHELTHGFDDQGRKFDGDGRLRPWWSEDVAAKFEERAACVERQYASYEVQPGLHLDGKLTLGENIADLGGAKLAARAYALYVADHGEEPRVVPELSNEQLVFVSLAQLWCSKERPEIERVLVRTDPHSRPRFRVNGPLANEPAFWEAFACAEGTPMHPKDACEVW